MATLDEAVAQAIAQQYQAAELAILARVVAALRKGLAANEFELVALGEAQALRAAAVATLGGLGDPMAQAVADAIAQAYSDGTAAAVAEIGAALPVERVASAQATAAVHALAVEVATGVVGAQDAVLRQVDDAYRQVVARVVASTLTGGSTPQQAAQAAVNDLFGQGLPSFKDRGGRNWRLPDYVEMAVRTGGTQATIRGHEQTLDRNGLDLVVVQPGPRACKVCDEWARAILSRYGNTGKQQVKSLTTGKPMNLTVKATLAAARAAGYGHPNCRCRLRAFIPGATDLNVIQRPAWDQAGYEAQQQQRAIESSIRKAKLVENTALDERVAAQARVAVRQQQARMRAHMAENPDLKRQSAREQVSGQFGNPGERKRQLT